jgi:hypothetical protein
LFWYFFSWMVLCSLVQISSRVPQKIFSVNFFVQANFFFPSRKNLVLQNYHRVSSSCAFFGIKFFFQNMSILKFRNFLKFYLGKNMCQYCEIGISKWSYEILRNVGCRKKNYFKNGSSQIFFLRIISLFVFQKVRGIFISFFFGCG